MWLIKNQESNVNKTGVINDPYRQTHSPASSDHYLHLKSGDDMCENSEHYRQ